MHDILCLDLAGITGVARWKEGWERPSITTFKLPLTDNDVGLYLCAYQRFFNAEMDKGIPTVVVFEKPWVGRNMTDVTAIKLFGLAAVTELFCRNHGVPRYYPVRPNVWRKHFTSVGSGKRDELKLITQQKAALIGFPRLTEDEADAFGILDHAVHCLKLDHPWAPGPLMMGRG